ncbi:type II toxin-antitoxin system PemK/MazF family toxin [Streptomyces sp. NPDC005318]|uniref:type II toxin-antitoxin system PemK/MazF family toxin n=1 Tax=Streptomyces sp. NPDC005318 TaxID=3157031 RepID=UPI0033B19A69
MDMSWWPAFGAVVLLALLAAIADGRGRAGGSNRRPGGRPRGRTRPPGRTEGPGGGQGRAPRPGEIWWAEVPYEDRPGSKDRPCLVLSVRGDAARIAKITSRHREDRPGVIALPPGAVGDARGRASFLETDELREVSVRGFRRRVGTVDATVWERVRGSG